MANGSNFQFPHSSPRPPHEESRTEDIAGDPGLKYSKEDANYRDAGGSDTYCGNCAHYTSSAFGGGVCSIVEGEISPGGVSDFWEANREEANSSLGDLIR